ncbi:nitroreductase family protein [Mangrovibacterium diazotrophicum]|uniref:Nitroreductase n=1 Tax=Mangrovibacterium diazotrophicum TaxID=1261403 RepID=A0A419W8Y0_9BACT|nr:nitroreductase family protein [Mangrovibacterium diazotrophicum]RKD91923.1 nitroreductase [Mangrovibacterium diazotrophicum]
MIDIIRQRRSIRKFTEQVVEEDKLKLLQEAALRSPASKSANAWEFVVVQDRSLIQQLATSKPFGSKLLETAPLAIVITADETKTEAWIEDCSVASVFLQLTAQALGLGSCWVQIRGRNHSDEKTAEEYVREVLEIPSNLSVLSIIAVGYPAQERRPVETADLQWEKIHSNKFGVKE